MNFWNHRAVQDQVDLTDLKAGTVRDDEDPPEEMDRSRLSPRQILALKAFHSGSSITDTAKAAGVTRQTLHRWRTQYHCFSEAMDCWEEGEMIIARSRLVDMANNAIDTLRNVIEDGNAQAAMMVLKSLRILRTYAPLKAPPEKMPIASGALAAGTEAGEPFDIAQGRQWKELNAAQEQLSPSAELAAGSGTVEPIDTAQGTQLRKADAERTSPTAPAALSDGRRDESRPTHAESPKPAKLAGKAGLAIRDACYSALQEVTGSYEMLRADHG